MKNIIFFIIISIFSSCSSSDEINVPWENYSAEVKERIEKKILERDCSSLQEEFNIASDNSDNQRLRTGQGNILLMQYIDQAIQRNKCN